MIVDGLNHPGIAGERNLRGGARASRRRGERYWAPVRFGLCDTCRYQRIVRTTRGSVFTLCERSRTEPEYPRYPRIPVLSCAGYVPIQRPGGCPEDTGVPPGA
jgi:hypothetical protein